MAFDSTNKGYRALVFGASGISGWAIMNQALLYPSPNTFDKVVGLTHRPLKEEDAEFPASPRLELYSGVNLSKEVAPQLAKIPEIEKITHVYFAAYTGHGSGYEELRRANVEMVTNALDGLEACCPAMKFFTLQTGGKAYGIEFVHRGVSIPVPTPESTPRVPEPLAQNVFYYAQFDAVQERSARAAWDFCEVRPDVIVGFVPRANAMNAAQCLGLFLALWRSLVGEGSEVPFPGCEAAWTARRTDTSQDNLARFHLFASVHGDRVAGQSFNVADGDVVSWGDLWPGICQWFGLKGVGPHEGVLSGSKWVRSKQSEYQKWEEANGVQRGWLESTDWSFMAAVVEGPQIDRHFDLSRAEQVGFDVKVNTTMSYNIAFNRMRKANIIP